MPVTLRRAAPLLTAILMLASAPVLAQVAAIQSQDTNIAGVTADIVEAKRSDGVLSVRVRVKNTGAKTAKVRIYHTYYGFKVDSYYVQAEGKKYFVLRDTEKAPLAAMGNMENQFEPDVGPGSTFTWWAKYPAPPTNVKKFNFNWPLGAPFDDVPITDK